MEALRRKDGEEFIGEDFKTQLVDVEAVHGLCGFGRIGYFQVVYRHVGTPELFAGPVQGEYERTGRTVRLEYPGNTLPARLPQDRGGFALAGTVGLHQPYPHTGREVLIERVDQVVERHTVFAGTCVGNPNPKPCGVLDPGDPDQRVGIDRAGETATGHVVDRIEYADFVLVVGALLFEQPDGLFDHVAQLGAFAP